MNVNNSRFTHVSASEIYVQISNAFKLKNTILPELQIFRNSSNPKTLEGIRDGTNV